MPLYKGSRYASAQAYTVLSPSGVAIAVIGDRDDVIQQKSGDQFHLFKAGDRLDTLALNYYGDPQLRWIILDANPKYLCETDIQPGDTLLIPSSTRLVGITR